MNHPLHRWARSWPIGFKGLNADDWESISGPALRSLEVGFPHAESTALHPDEFLKRCPQLTYIRITDVPLSHEYARRWARAMLQRPLAWPKLRIDFPFEFYGHRAICVPDAVLGELAARLPYLLGETLAPRHCGFSVSDAVGPAMAKYLAHVRTPDSLLSLDLAYPPDTKQVLTNQYGPLVDRIPDEGLMCTWSIDQWCAVVARHAGSLRSLTWRLPPTYRADQGEKFMICPPTDFPHGTPPGDSFLADVAARFRHMRHLELDVPCALARPQTLVALFACIRRPREASKGRTGK